MKPDETPNPAAEPGRSPVSLADELHFTVGTITVRPSRREIAGADWIETIEPRVMEVLVVLAAAKGEVVSRRQLIERCWHGRAVSDDAIERCIARIRKIAERGHGLAVETIPRVGYRLAGAETVRYASEVHPGRTFRTWWFALAATVLTCAAAILLFVPPRSPNWTVSSLRMLTTFPVRAFDPAIAPDGSRIAYAADSDAQPVSHIFLRRLRDGDVRQLTRGPTGDSSPVWSPTGDRLAFVRRRDGKPCEIRTLSLATGAQTSLARCHVDETTHLAWSRDDRLFFSDREETILPERIVSLDRKSGVRRFVTNPDRLLIGDISPAVSPDGSKLAFERVDAGDLLVFVRDLASGALRRIGEREADARGLAWSADGASLFVAIERPSGSAIWTFPALPGHSGPPVRLTLNSLEYGALGQGPGDMLAFEARNERFNVATPSSRPASPDAIRGNDMQHGAPDQLDIAPDGSLVASVGNEGDEALWLKRPGSTTWQRLERTAAVALFNPRWSPDGSEIAFAATMPSGKGLFVISALGRAPRLVVPIAIDQTNPAIWTEDGKSLIYPVLSPMGWRLWKADLEPLRPAMPISGYGWCSVRLSGGVLYGSRVDRGGIWRVADSSVPVFAGLHADRCYDWSMVSGTIVYLDRSNPGLLRLVTHSLSGGQDRVAPVPGLPLDDAGSSPFALNPRTGHPLYLRTWNENSIGVLGLSR